jgi:hypothetical protein
LKLCVDNSSVVHVTNAIVASSKPMMREIRRLKKMLDELGLQLSSEWIPSVANKFADALSRRFSPGDLAVRQTLRRSVVDGMMVPLDSFPLRPLSEHPVTSFLTWRPSSETDASALRRGWDDGAP